MKLVMWLIVLVGFYQVGFYLYNMGYFDSVKGSFDNTYSRTADFVTDKAVDEFNY